MINLFTAGGRLKHKTLSLLVEDGLSVLTKIFDY